MGRTPGAVALVPPPPVVRASAAQQLGEDQDHWHEKAADRREAVRSAEQRVVALKALLDQMQRRAGSPSAGDGDLERDIAKAQEDIDSAQERLAKAQRHLEDLQDEARRKGVPADWLR